MSTSRWLHKVIGVSIIHLDGLSCRQSVAARRVCAVLSRVIAGIPVDVSVSSWVVTKVATVLSPTLCDSLERIELYHLHQAVHHQHTPAHARTVGAVMLALHRRARS